MLICFPFIISLCAELILYDRTLAYGPKMCSPVACLQCLKPLEKPLGFRCPGCQWPMCNEKCARGRMHEEECPIIAKGVHKVRKKKLMLCL